MLLSKESSGAQLTIRYKHKINVLFFLVNVLRHSLPIKQTMI